MHKTPRRLIDHVTSPLDAESSKDTSTLWITGPSLELQQKLVKISGLQPTVILGSDTPCDTDTFPNHTIDLIADAILCRALRWIVVCGQPSDVPLRSGKDQFAPQESTSGYDQMLQRIRDRMERQQRGQERVRTQLGQIRSKARVAFELTSHAISLCGMFYIPESDAFLVYDRTEEQFVPIVDARSWYF